MNEVSEPVSLGTALQKGAEYCPTLVRAYFSGAAKGDALLNLGRALLEAQLETMAVPCLVYAVRHAPSSTIALSSLALAFERLGEHAVAVRVLEDGIRLGVGAIALERKLACLLFHRLDRVADGIALAKSIALRTGSEPDCRMLAECLLRRCSVSSHGNDAGVSAVIAEVRCATGPLYDPRLPNRAVAAALLRVGRYEEARMIAEDMCAADPNDGDARCTLGWALTLMGLSKDALPHFEKALKSRPRQRFVAWSYCSQLLRVGDFGRARQVWTSNHCMWNAYPKQWRGARLTGARVTFHLEHQGFGDALQFVRFAADLSRDGNEVLVRVAQPLRRLIASVRGVAKVLTADDVFVSHDHESGPLAPMMLMYRDQGELGRSVPYLHVRREDTVEWRRRLGVGGLFVGVAWRCSSGDAIEGQSCPTSGPRSMPLVALRPLALAQGLRLCSLQRHARPREVAGVLSMRDHTDAWSDFYDVAAMISALDVVVSVDTSIAHLAAALGKPVAVLLPFVSSWRWGDRADSCSWYPSARLFRQDRSGYWCDAVARTMQYVQGLDAAATSQNYCS